MAQSNFDFRDWPFFKRVREMGWRGALIDTLDDTVLRVTAARLLAGHLEAAVAAYRRQP